jgi:hypothetical protein
VESRCGLRVVVVGSSVGRRHRHQGVHLQKHTGEHACAPCPRAGAHAFPGSKSPGASRARGESPTTAPDLPQELYVYNFSGASRIPEPSSKTRQAWALEGDSAPAAGLLDVAQSPAMIREGDLGRFYAVPCSSAFSPSSRSCRRRNC